MLNIVIAVLYAIVVLIALLLVGLVLIQPSKGGGLGATFGGVGEGVFGAQAMSHLSKLTIVLMSIFFGLTLVLAVISGHRHQVVKSLVESEPVVNSAPVKNAEPASEKPAAPAKSATETAPSTPAPAN